MIRPVLALVVLVGVGCGYVSEGTKKALNKGGELAGTAATEVVEGVATGVEETWDVAVELSPAHSAAGLVIGTTSVEADEEGRQNRLVVYLSTSGAVHDTLTAIAYDKRGAEMGRTTQVITMAANTGDHIVLSFQPRTDLGRKCRVEIR